MTVRGADDKPTVCPCIPSLRPRRDEAYLRLPAGVVELVDTPDLGSGAARRGGSSPFARTTINLQP